MVYSSRAFWNDIIQHLEIKPQNFQQIDSGIQRIFESMEESLRYCAKALKMDSTEELVSI